MIEIPLYPCDRGVPGGMDRGYHHFLASAYGVVCTYCGKRGPAEAPRVTHGNSTQYCWVCGGTHTESPEIKHPSYVRRRYG
jgi:hypothetical protein